MAQAAKHELKIGSRSLAVSNPEKLLFPVARFTKAQVIDYYVRVAKWLLPHLKDRPVTLKRYPDGVAAEHFYEKDAPSFTPEWVRTFPVPRRGGGPDIKYIIIDDIATLAWSANLANLEIHPFLHRVPKIENPTLIAFDLDPGEGATILECAKVSFLLRDVLERLKLKSFAKVSGSKGIQLYVPLNTPITYSVTQPFARTLAELLEREHPQLVISEMTKSMRSKKVFIDWSQNSDYKTTVSVYSLRAKRQHPFVSVPVTWDELQEAVEAKDSKRLYWQPEAALERFADVGDLFAPVLKLKQNLPDVFVKELSTRTAAAKPSAKRAATTEPARRSAQGGRRRFVVQKHAASHLHYDFRLEMHDVLKSWAVPKGVPYEIDERRLAQATEDHPIEYLDFEGTIPRGQYGGGTVMVWDIGTYELIEGNYYRGRLDIHLEGKKLKGEWLLMRDRGNEKSWSLVKAGKNMKRVSAKQDDASALTGRTMQEIAGAGDHVWQSNRTPVSGPDLTKLPKAEMKFVPPMMAKLGAALPEGDQWQYEIKFDGYRALALRTSSGVKLLSRNNNELKDRFPSVASACEALSADTILDGEVVALDAQGRPSFNLLQNFQTARLPVIYYVFDLLAWRGKSLLSLPLEQRRTLLREALAGTADPIRLSETLEASADDLIKAAKQQGLEGLVAKRKSSAYEPGQRSGSWIKFKVNRSAEFVVGGYKPGKNGFDNLAVGYYEGKRLIFIAKVKNGFTPRTKEQAARRFQGLETNECPFDNLPEPKDARRGEALTAEAMKKYRWLKPELVAQVEFTDWTDANHLRHSRFIALRDDKDAREVRKEVPA